MCDQDLKDKLRKLLEIGSNVAIIVVAVVLGVYLIGRYFSPPSVPASGATVQAEAIKPGAKLPLVNVDWSGSDRNLLMVLSTACHFCSESMPFYKRLIEKNAAGKSVRMIAALPQDVPEATKYLADNNVTVDQVIKANPGEAMVRGTPTLLLVDKNGVVLDTWIGKLPPEKENEVIERAFSPVVVVGM